jgi:hypothetical protein
MRRSSFVAPRCQRTIFIFYLRQTRAAHPSSQPSAFIATAATHRQEEIITAIVKRESHMIVPPLVERLALAAAAAENPALANDPAVTVAGFRCLGVQGAKCVHDIVECDCPSSEILRQEAS